VSGFRYWLNKCDKCGDDYVYRHTIGDPASKYDTLARCEIHGGSHTSTTPKLSSEGVVVIWNEEICEG